MDKQILWFQTMNFIDTAFLKLCRYIDVCNVELIPVIVGGIVGALELARALNLLCEYECKYIKSACRAVVDTLQTSRTREVS